MTTQPPPYQPSANRRHIMSGTDLIAAERRRQIEQEGWTPEHDAEHDREDLAWAAASYALPPKGRSINHHGVPWGWPMEPSAWKPTPDDRVRELVKAGALIAAEIDRLAAREQRPTRPTTAPPPPGTPDGKGWDDLDATTGQP